jgi:cell division cycle 2-like protein
VRDVDRWILKSRRNSFIPILGDTHLDSEMANLAKSRWADDEEDKAVDAQRKREKELKKKAKAERQRRIEEDETLPDQEAAIGTNGHTEAKAANGDSERPAKRRRLSPEYATIIDELPAPKLLRFPALEWGPCRHVDNFEKLNHIEEGSYGWVSRARETATGDVVALKKLKMDNANDGFPVTGLREIQTLMASRHTNIVALREVVMGDKLDE